jgi:hypothetical protein
MSTVANIVPQRVEGLALEPPVSCCCFPSSTFEVQPKYKQLSFRDGILHSNLLEGNDARIFYKRINGGSSHCTCMQDSFLLCCCCCTGCRSIAKRTPGLLLWIRTFLFLRTLPPRWKALPNILDVFLLGGAICHIS